LIVKKQHRETVSAMYGDEPKIQCVPISTGGEFDDDGERKEVERITAELSPTHTLNIGHENYWKLQQAFPQFDCHQRFYAALGYDFSIRYTDFKYERNYEEEERVYKKLNPENVPYIFVHGDSSRGRVMDYDRISKHNTENFKIIENDVSESLLNFGLVLERAKQVHLMESSFRAYVETLNTDGVRLFLHWYVRQAENMFSCCGKGKNATSKDWTVLI
jgi:glutaredoxin